MKYVWMGLGIWALLINVYGFIRMGIDKRAAKRHAWRVPEKEFFLCGALFGSIGILLGMRIFHHKTLHKTFSIGIPLMLIAQIALIVLAAVKYGW